MHNINIYKLYNLYMFILCICFITLLYLTFFDPMDCSLPGSSVHIIFQARILEQVAISFSKESSQPRDGTCISYVSYIARWVLFFFFYQLEANYFTILQWFLSYIDMNQPWIYMHSPSRPPLPPPSPPDPSGSSQCTSPEHLSHAPNLGW